MALNTLTAFGYGSIMTSAAFSLPFLRTVYGLLILLKLSACGLAVILVLEKHLLEAFDAAID